MIDKISVMGYFPEIEEAEEELPDQNPLISDAALAANEAMHEDCLFDGLDPLVYAPGLIEVFDEFDCMSILDYGCGGAALSRYLSLPIFNFDICRPEYAHEPPAADLVVCFDVLEHVEPEYLDEVIRHIKSKTRKVAHFVIANVPDETKLLPDGRNPHLIVEPPNWWYAKLREHFPFVREELCIHYWARKFTAGVL
jgi:hypothetical protein